MKRNIHKNGLDKIAKELAKQYGNEDMEDPESTGFIRFMMFSCLFFRATGQCGGVPCRECKATKVIEHGLNKHPELAPEYDALKKARGENENFSCRC